MTGQFSRYNPGLQPTRGRGLRRDTSLSVGR